MSAVDAYTRVFTTPIAEAAVYIASIVQALYVFLIAFQPLIIFSMAQAKVSDLEFKRLSAVEILRFTVDELKNEYSRTIPFASHALERDLQVK